MFKIMRFALVVFILVFVARLTEKLTEGFTIYSIQSKNQNQQAENPPLPQVFGQKFKFLGSGGQFFVFASEDGAYVLKFFKHPFIKARRAKFQDRLNRIFLSCKLSLEKLPEETGMLYVHLNKTDSLHQSARIVDKFGIEYRIELDNVDFVLQKRAELPYPHLLHLIENDEIATAKEAIDSLCALILTRCQKGIHDEDAKLHRNCGFIDNQAIIIDVGSLKEDLRRQDREVQSADLIKCTERLKSYLDEVSPELAAYLDEVRRCTK